MGVFANLLALVGFPMSKHMGDLRSTDWEVRYSAVQQIGFMARKGIDTTQALPLLIQLALRDPVAFVRSYALNAINPMLQKKYLHRPEITAKFITQMALCLLNNHADADGIQKEAFPGQGSCLMAIRGEAAANLIAIGTESLDAITACAQTDPEGARSARGKIDYIYANLRAMHLRPTF